MLSFLRSSRRADGSPRQPAEPYQLLRRFHLDLTGLPPSITEQDAFLRNPTPEALDRIMDDLLAAKPMANAGRGTGSMSSDMPRPTDTSVTRSSLMPGVIATMSFAPSMTTSPTTASFSSSSPATNCRTGTPRRLIATGFNRLGAWDDEPADPETDRFDQLDDIVSTTSQAFLGLTLGCARCHNHKFDPLTARDYYSMVAIFNGLERPRKGRTELDLPVAPRKNSNAKPSAIGRSNL